MRKANYDQQTEHTLGWQNILARQLRKLFRVTETNRRNRFTDLAAHSFFAAARSPYRRRTEYIHSALSVLCGLPPSTLHASSWAACCIQQSTR